MSKTIKVDGLAEAVEQELTLYNKTIVAGTKKSARKHMRAMVKETKAQRYKEDTGDYRKAIASRTLYEDVNGVEMQWYVKAPHYRLTHLLEHGHATANGGRTIAYGTVGKAATKAVEGFQKDVEEVIKNGG